MSMTKIILFSAAIFLTACSDNSKSIYGNLDPNEDGVVDSIISEETESTRALDPSLVLPDTLTQNESDIVRKKYKNQVDKFSFIVVDAEKKNVIRSYRSFEPRRLASVTKVVTALTALKNIKTPDVTKISSMLKNSNNSEASRYLRLSVLALANYVVPGSGYTETHSCPAAAIEKEAPAANIMYHWIQSQVKDVDWEGSALKDGAGCNYGNLFNTLQVVKVLQFADNQGSSFSGKNFEQLLSISGVDGTWANHNTDNKGQVLAKTGTLDHTANLAGYFYARRNGVLKKYYFAVLVEKKPEDSALARTFIESLVRNWINYFAKQEGESLGGL